MVEYGKIPWTIEETRNMLREEANRRKEIYNSIDTLIKNNPPYTREELMTHDIRNTLNERGSVYGAFKDNAFVAQTLKDIWRESKGHGRLCMEPITRNTQSVVNEGMEMVMHKIARLCNGDPAHLDSWVDIVGYAQLVVDHLKEVQKPETTIRYYPSNTTVSCRSSIYRTHGKRRPNW